MRYDRMSGMWSICLNILTTRVWSMRGIRTVSKSVSNVGCSWR